MDNKELIGQRINTALAKRDMKQKQLAKAIRVTDNTISYFCSGKRTPNIQQLIAIAKELDVSTDYLLGRTSTMTINEDIQVAYKTTGLSETAIKKLQQFRHSRYGTMESDAVVIGGDKAIVLISLINDLIEADDCKPLFTDIAGFLVHGGAFQTDDYSNVDFSDVDPVKARAYFRANGKEVVLGSDASELCLQLATEKLKNIFRGVLEKEVNKNGKH